MILGHGTLSLLAIGAYEQIYSAPLTLSKMNAREIDCADFPRVLPGGGRSPISHVALCKAHPAVAFPLVTTVIKYQMVVIRSIGNCRRCLMSLGGRQGERLFGEEVLSDGGRELAGCQKLRCDVSKSDV